MKRRLLYIASLFVILVPSVGLLVSSPVDAAGSASPTGLDIPDTVWTATFQDRAHITVKFGSVATMTFVDKDVFDSTHNYVESSANPSDLFCNTSSDNITLLSSPNFSDSTIPGRITLYYKQGAGCIGGGGSDTPTISISNPGKVAQPLLKWNGSAISPLGDQTESPYDESSTYTQGTNTPNFYINHPNATDCNNGDIFDVVLFGSGDTHQGKLYAIGGGGSSIPSDLSGYSIPSGCGILQGPTTVHLAGTPNSTSTGGGSTAPGGGGGGGSTTTCESTSGDLGWITCTVIEGLANFLTNTYKDLLQPLLVIQTKSLVNPSQPYYQVWSDFRIYGDVFLVIALLVIVFGESIGGGAIDAYTAKKVLPRLMVAAVLINLSIYLVAIAVDFSNVIGAGIYSLMMTPFGGGSGGVALHISTGGGLLTALGGATAVIWGSVAAGGFLSFLILGILLPAALLFIVTILTLIIRQGIIYVLVFVSPVAFALYCLPNTERYFRKWWDLLFRALMVYPIISAIFAMCNILAYTFSHVHLG